MLKIAILGKANSGKNTLSRLIVNQLDFKKGEYKYMAFADPLKKILLIAYPDLPKKYVYGASKYRSEIIPGAFKNGSPLTIRQALIDLGDQFGRGYKEDIWVINFDCRVKKIHKKHIIVSDVRRRNEFDYLKQLGFFMIRLINSRHTVIDDASESDQDLIIDSEFHCVIDNNTTKQHLKAQMPQLIQQILTQQI